MRGRTAFFCGGAVFGAVAGASAAWWLLADDPPPRAGGPPGMQSAHPPLPPLSVRDLRRPPVERPVVRPARPAGPFEAALQAVTAYTGDGMIRCEVGDRVPAGPVSGLTHGQVDERGVLIGAVSEPEGQARIGSPDDPPQAAPLVVVQWRSAWPGSVGQCTVLDPERVAVTGTVVRSDGRPLDPAERAAVQVGNSVEGGVPLGPDGRFVVPCWRGAPCSMAVRARPDAPWGPFTVVVPEGPVTGLTLTLADPGPVQTVREWLEQQVAEDVWIEATPDPLELALAEADLPEAARRLVEGWREEAADARALHRELLAQYEALPWLAEE